MILLALYFSENPLVFLNGYFLHFVQGLGRSSEQGAFGTYISALSHHHTESESHSHPKLGWTGLIANLVHIWSRY
ncbi:hypothetical protein ACFX11_030595 [Malus domestica]